MLLAHAAGTSMLNLGCKLWEGVEKPRAEFLSRTKLRDENIAAQSDENTKNRGRHRWYQPQ